MCHKRMVWQRKCKGSLLVCVYAYLYLWVHPLCLLVYNYVQPLILWPFPPSFSSVYKRCVQSHSYSLINIMNSRELIPQWLKIEKLKALCDYAPVLGVEGRGVVWCVDRPWLYSVLKMDRFMYQNQNPAWSSFWIVKASWSFIEEERDSVQASRRKGERG